jgi:hypothetical protein
MVPLDTLPEDWAIGSPYGVFSADSKAAIERYEKLFGKEKGFLRPPA